MSTSGLTYSGATEFDVVEGNTPVSTLSVTGATSWSIISVTGYDHSLFTINSAGELAFSSAPDFESPQDVYGTAGDNIHMVRVEATDGSNTVTIDVEVTVLDMWEKDVDGCPSLTDKSPSTGGGTIFDRYVSGFSQYPSLPGIYTGYLLFTFPTHPTEATIPSIEKIVIEGVEEQSGRFDNPRVNDSGQHNYPDDDEVQYPYYGGASDNIWSKAVIKVFFTNGLIYSDPGDLCAYSMSSPYGIIEQLDVTENYSSTESACAGTTLSLSLTVDNADGTDPTLGANGGALTYQWQKLVSSNWTDVSGASSSSYAITSSSQDGDYRCIVREVISGTDYYDVYYSGTTTVTSFAAPTISASSVTICEGATTTLSASSSNTTGATWTTSDALVATVSSAGLVTGVAAGTATITYTDGNGCTVTSTINVTANPSNSLLVSDATICVGSSGTITVANSQNGYTYQLRLDSDDSNVGSSQTGDGGTLSFPVSPSTTTTYNVYVTNGTCPVELTDKSTVTVDAASVGGDVYVQGTTNTTTSVTSGTNSTVIEVSGNTGNVVRWESSADNTFSSPTTIAQTTSALTVSILTATTYYRAIIQSGTCTTATSNSIEITVTTPSSSGSACDPSNPYDKIVSGYHQSIALKDDGTYVAWGQDMGPNGIGDDELSPVALDATHYSALSGRTIYKATIGGDDGSSDNQYFALTDDGFYVWGGEGKVVNNSLTSSSAMAKMSSPTGGNSYGLPTGVSPTDVAGIHASFQTLGLFTNSGEVYILTQASKEATGSGVSSLNSSTWYQVKTGSGASDILTNVVALRFQVSSSSQSAFMALTNSGDIYTWGNSTYLGNGSSQTSRAYATQMTMPTGVTAPLIIGVTGGDKVSASTSYNAYFVLGEDKKLYSLGNNSFKQLGDFTTTERKSWTTVNSASGTPFTNVKFFSVQEHNASFPCGALITETGGIYGWGYNDYNMLGRQRDGNSYDPGLPGGFDADNEKALSVEVGGHTMVYLKEGTTQFCYVGHRVDGSMGDGTTTNTSEATANCSGTPSLSLCGSVPVSADHTTSVISTNPTSIIANGTTTSLVTVQLKDNSGNNLTTTGGTVVINTNLGSIGSVTDNNDGTYNATLISSTTAGTATLSYTLNGTSGTNTATCIFTPLAALDFTGTLSSFTTCEGTASSAQSVTIGGSGVTSNVSVTVPTGLELSTDGSTYSTTLTLVPASGVISETIYVRVASTASSGSISGNLSATDGGSLSDAIAVSATVNAIDDATFSYSSSAYCANDSDPTPSVTTSGGTFSSTSGLIISTSTGAIDLSASTFGTYTITYTTSGTCPNSSTASVSVSPLPVISNVNTTNPTTCSGTNGVITFSVTNVADGTITVSYTGGTFSATVSSGTATSAGLAAGTYNNLSVSNANGCSNTTTPSATLADPTAPSFGTDLSSTETLCAGEDLTVAATGTGTITYQWYESTDNSTWTAISGVTSATYASTASKYYKVVATDGTTNCTTESTVANTTVNALPTVGLTSNATSNTICAGESVSFTATGGSTYEFFVNGSSQGSASSTSTFVSTTLSNSDVVTVEVTNSNGCSAISSGITMTVNALPTVTVDAATDVLCHGADNGSVSITATGTATLSYAWTDGASYSSTSEDISSLAPGTYMVTVTDGNGCSSTASATITEPAVALAATSTVTNTNSTSGTDGTATVTPAGGTSGYTYLWSDSQTTATATGLAAGTYSVTVTDANGCTATSSVTVYDPLDATASESTPVSCNGGSDAEITVTVTGGAAPYTYLWDDASASTTATITGLSAGSYEVTVTDANGNTTTANVTIGEPTQLVVAVGTVTDVTCTGNTDGAVTTTISGGTTSYTFSWDNGETTQNLSGVVEGTYVLTVTDANGCTETATAVVGMTDNVAPIVVTQDITVSLDALGNVSITTSDIDNGSSDDCGIDTYALDKVDFNCSDLGANTVTLTVTDVNGNSATGTATVTVEDIEDPVISCPSNVTAYADATSNGTAVTWTAATATDNCSIQSITSDIANGSTFTLGTTTVTYTATDGSGNTATCMFDVTVLDTVSPVISGCPADITQTNDLDSCGAAVSWTAPTFYDNSGSYTVVYSHNSGDYFPVGTTTVTVTVTDAAGNSSVCTFDVTVEDNQAPYVFPETNVSITLNGDGMYTMTAGQLDSASYDNCGIDSMYLSNDFANCNAMPTMTTYLVVVDTHGNMDSALVTVNVLPSATAVLATTAMVTDVSCYGTATGEIGLTTTGGVAPYTYDWNTGDITSAITNLGIGMYTFTVTDTNGCTMVDSVFIDQPDTIIASSVLSVYGGGYNVSQFGAADGSITMSIAGGTLPYSYDWNTGAYNTMDLNSIPAGAYTLVIKDSLGCTYTHTDTLTEPEQLIVSAQALTLVICPEDTSGEAIATISGGVQPYSILWDLGDTTDYVGNLQMAIYEVTITDANGAVASDTVFVDALDYDCDGIYNVDEGGTPNGGNGDIDTDGDGIPNQEDEDSDNDGLPDSEEFDTNQDGINFDDCDEDGIPDFLDPDFCGLLIPDVFTPNGDGDNDTWEILGIHAHPDNTVTIYNRWGELVYYKESYDNEFNGRANSRTYLNKGDGLLPTGTYYYMVKLYATGDVYTGYVYITK